MINYFSFLIIISTIAMSLLQVGCSPVGPDYKVPDVQIGDDWKNSKLVNAASVEDKELMSWWRIFEDETLNGLIEQVRVSGLSIREAKARVREARARRGVTSASKMPSVDSDMSASISKTDNDNSMEIYKAGFDAAWELDLFGGVRREVEAAEADLQTAEENFRDVMLILIGETSFNYVQLRTLQRRLLVAKESLNTQLEAWQLASFRHQAGLGNELAVAQSQYTLEDTRSKIPEIERDIEQVKNKLAVLVGKMPGELDEKLDSIKPIPRPSNLLSVGIPVEVVRRRPDVRKAERIIAAETARVGVATAELYPKFSLSGVIALESASIGNLFDATSQVISSAGRVSWNLFDAGSIRNSIEIRSAIQEQSVVQYEATVLSAIEEVENAFMAYAKEKVRKEFLTKAVNEAKRATDLSLQQYASGLVDFNDVLETERSLQSFQERLAQSDGQSAEALIRLYKAAGGGIPATVQ